MAGEAVGEKFDRLDKLCAKVIANASDMPENTVDFANSMADRLSKYKERTFVSDAQWRMVSFIERTLDEKGL